ncbi:MAG TPA: gliding motility lipoprotein GldH [Sunxiuqinia sp.]|nr:gliding motility lipoprotein GldH [Sunxiuqinia sp.]
MRNILKVIILIGILASCDSKRVFEDYKTIDPSGWNKDSLARFDVAITDTVHANNIYIDVRNNGNYPNSNLWLFTQVQAPNGKLLTDTVEYILADKAGKWRGSGIGDLFDNQFLYRKNVRFEHPGVYHFSVQQGMRAKNLKGIHDIGLRVEKQNDN